jgi:hypothetical protein
VSGIVNFSRYISQEIPPPGLPEIQARVLIFAAPVRGESRRMGFASLSAGVRAAPAIEVGFAVEGDRTLLSILAILSAVILLCPMSRVEA